MNDGTRTHPTSANGAIRIGIGGWNYEPWRNNFYPEKWPQARELEYASRQLTAIEINSTFYSSQKPSTFAKWRDATPDGFVFSLKAPRFATNRRVLADAGDSIERFVRSGIAELGSKLGPILWQFAVTKRFDAVDMAAFIAMLPPDCDGLPLRHVLDVRHSSFKCAEYLELARRHRVSTVFTDSDDYASFADITGPLVYARLMRTDAGMADGMTPEALDQIAACALQWQTGGEPDALPRVAPPPSEPAGPRDVFLYFISGAKEKAPAAATALIRRLDALSAEPS